MELKRKTTCAYLDNVSKAENIRKTLSLALEHRHRYTPNHLQLTEPAEISLNSHNTSLLIYITIALLVNQQLNALQAAHRQGLVPLLKQQHEALTGLTARSTSFKCKQQQQTEKLKQFTEGLMREINKDQVRSAEIEKTLKGKLAVREGLTMTVKLLMRKTELSGEDPGTLLDQHIELEAEYLALNEECETITQQMEAAAGSFAQELATLRARHSEKTRLLSETQTENSQLRAAERLKDSLQARLSLAQQQTTSVPCPPPTNSATESQVMLLKQDLLYEEGNYLKSQTQLSELTKELEFLSDFTLKTAETQRVAQRICILQQERAKECAALKTQSPSS